MTSYDHWKTTEPEPSLSIVQCAKCLTRLPANNAWITFDSIQDEPRWFCDECAAEEFPIDGEDEVWP